MTTPDSIALGGAIINGLQLIVVIVSVWYVRKQLKETHEWNRIKTTQEVLYGVSQGDMQVLMQSVRKDFECDVAADPPPTFSKFVSRVPEARREEFRSTVIRICNGFEVLAIAVRNSVIDEDIAYDYLGKTLTAYYFFAESLIEERRAISKFPRAAGSLEYCARRWQPLLDKENDEVEKHRKHVPLVPPKRKL